MVTDNKILTVSYGTFSCTLEGFEDPFSAMRSIAEYFRDLAADDRYFGAEPPTPDPDRIQELAEYQAQRRVDSRIERDGSLTLTPAESHADDLSDGETETSAADDADEPEPVAEVRADTEETPELAQDAPETAVEAPTAEEEGAEAEEAKVQPMESNGPQSKQDWNEVPEGLAKDVADDVADDITVPDDPDADADVGEHADDDAPLAAEADDATEDAFEDDPDMAADELDAAADELDHPPQSSEPIKSTATIASVAEKLARIRAAVADKPAEAGVVEEVQSDSQTPDQPDLSAAFGPVEGGDDATSEPTASDWMSEDDLDKIEDALDDYTPEEQGGERAKILAGTSIDDAADGAADKLFAKTDTRLDGDEAKRRRSAIAHLKAAVSATVADSEILSSRSKKSQESQSIYRDDLAQAVQGTAVAEDEYDPDHDDDRPAPLVLGAENRVASDARIKAAGEQRPPTRTPDESFSDFADRMGAQDLTDLLEAAAAYSAHVEGRPQFSRPHIMKHVSDLTEEGYSREDGLRSFGALLRQGRIHKLKRGVFTLSDGSRFFSSNRMAGE